MSRVSKYKLDKLLEIELYNQLWKALAYIDSLDKSSDFFSDILTETEKLMIAKRLAAAVLVERGKNTSDIHNALHLSYTTVGTVMAWVKNAKPETQKILQKISKEKNWEDLFDKIDNVLGTIPPRRHSDWGEEYAKRRIELNKRLTRKKLR